MRKQYFNIWQTGKKAITIVTVYAETSTQAKSIYLKRENLPSDTKLSFSKA